MGGPPPRPSGPSALERLFHINDRLAAAARLTAATLAAELGVSVRTVKRDLDTLRDRHGAEIHWDPVAANPRYISPRSHERGPIEARCKAPVRRA